MSAELTIDPVSFLDDLGALHDVVIDRVCFDADGPRLIMETRDLTWGIESGSGYVPRPRRLVFSDLQAFSIVAGQDKFHTTLLSERPWISEAYAFSKGGASRMDFVMSTSERWYVEFGRLEVEDLP